MSLNSKIADDYIISYKNGDTLRLNVLRLVKTAIKNRLVELRLPGGELSEKDLIDIISKQAKQRQDSITQFKAAGREDLADKEEAELQILKSYLPKMLEGDDLINVIEDAISQTNAKTMADMGKVMKSIMSAYPGQVDGSALSAIVRKKLS